jgi:hypothetical protein
VKLVGRDHVILFPGDDFTAEDLDGGYYVDLSMVTVLTKIPGQINRTVPEGHTVVAVTPNGCTVTIPAGRELTDEEIEGGILLPTANPGDIQFAIRRQFVDSVHGRG